MGNACGCADSNDGEATNANISGIQKKQADPFQMATHKSLIVPEAFAGLSSGDKDQLLVDVLKLIVTKGDPAQIKTNNVHLKKELVKQTQKIVVNGEIFDGEVIDGIANGRGRVKLTSGADFDGYFVGGFRKAKGTTKHPNLVEEAIYGEEGQLEGASTHKAANGTFFTFFNERGLKNGPAYTDSPNEQQFDLYIANRRNGVTVKIAKDKKTLSLQEFKDDKQSGPVVEYALKAAQPAQPQPNQPAQPAQPAQQAPAQPTGKPAPADPKAAPADPKAAPADPKAAPADPKAAPADPKAANPAQEKPADPKAAPQEKGPAPAPIQQAPGQPAPVKQNAQAPAPQKA